MLKTELEVIMTNLPLSNILTPSEQQNFIETLYSRILNLTNEDNLNTKESSKD